MCSLSPVNQGMLGTFLMTAQCTTHKRCGCGIALHNFREGTPASDSGECCSPCGGWAPQVRKLIFGEPVLHMIRNSLD
eukprot:6195870-Amphidinium_carterae.1